MARKNKRPRRMLYGGQTNEGGAHGFNGGSGSQSSGGTHGGSAHQAAISQASTGSPYSSPSTAPTGPQNSREADDAMAAKYGMTPQKYISATEGLGNRIYDANDTGEGALNWVGKHILGLGGYYEANPALNPGAPGTPGSAELNKGWAESLADANAGITRPVDASADRHIDALQLAATAIGAVTPFPAGTIYGLAKQVMGQPQEFGQINLGPSGPDVPMGNLTAQQKALSGYTGPGAPPAQQAMGPGAGASGNAGASPGVIPPSALAQIAAQSTGSAPPATTPPSSTTINPTGQTYHPFTGDITKYGENYPEQNYFTMAGGGMIPSSSEDYDTVQMGTDENGEPIYGQILKTDEQMAYLRHRRNNPEFAGGSADGLTTALAEKHRYLTGGSHDDGTYGSNWSDDAGVTSGYAKGGYVSAPNLAQFGHGDDTTMAHVAPGEMMLPPHFHRKHPELVKSIAHHMRNDGMDPSQYIAGANDTPNEATGLPQYGFWKTIGNIAKDIAPELVGAGTSYLTGSDILGGLGAGVTDKLLGGSWGEAALTGLGTGIGSSLLGVSGNGPGALNNLLGSGGVGSVIPGTAVSAPGSGGGGGGILNTIKSNPLAAAAAALGIAGAFAGKGKSQTASASNSTQNNTQFNDPALAQQIRDGGYQSDKTYNAPPSDFNWYQYGQLPEWNFFNNNNSAISPVTKAHGGTINGASPMQPQSYVDDQSLAHSGGAAQGPGGGQDDKIPVYLSAKEYVMPADVVSDLGDGNADEGARKLNKMRDKVRVHKGRKGSPPKAKAPEQYIS